MQHYILLEKKDSNSVIDCLLEHFKNSRESGEDEMWFRWTDNMLDEVIDYLEEIKRAEDKWSDIKPSEDAIDCREIYMADHKRVFNVGDWIIDKQTGIHYQIVKEDSSSFLLRNTDGVDTTYLPIQVVENHYQHWNIGDSKPGDILSMKFDKWEKIVLFIECNNRGVTGYGISLKDGKLFDEDEKIIYSQTWSWALQPATAEQRERLFKEFDAYGYKWDAKRKKMMIPSQNSDIELWGYEDEKTLNIILDVLYNKTSISSEKCQEIEKWLHKLKERISWVDFDEAMRGRVSTLLKKNGYDVESKWVCSLGPQPEEIC